MRLRWLLAVALFACHDRAIAPRDASAPYQRLDDTGAWSTFDLATVSSAASGYAGGAFDGRYVYFAPSSHLLTWNGLAVRYDTMADFASRTSWSTFDMTVLDASAEGFAGAVFDGRYVYFVPNYRGGGGRNLIVRYDAKADFASRTSWSFLDANGMGLSRTASFAGATFDGHYVYFVPNSSCGLECDVLRFDTTASFTAPASWVSFNTMALGLDDSYWGAIFDGRYLDLVPSWGAVLRKDTQASYTDMASWSTFDPKQLGSSAAESSYGGAFDGRSMYLVPYARPDNTVASTVVRYDTGGSFTTATSWSTFDTTGANPQVSGFAGAAFDGRGVYFVPANSPPIVVRDDTTGPFDAVSSWSSFDLREVSARANGFRGAVFDGQYVYFVPNADTVVARFRATATRSTSGGSFF